MHRGKNQNYLDEYQTLFIWIIIKVNNFNDNSLPLYTFLYSYKIDNEMFEMNILIVTFTYYFPKER